MPPDTEHVVVIALLGIFCIAGVIGNSLVLYIYSKKRERTTSSVFILTLAGTDFITCLLIIPFTMVVLYVDYRLRIDFFCKLYMFLITCNVPFSAFVMVAIAFDRYFCICHPFLHAINIPRAKCIVVFMALVACVLGLITAMMHGTFSIESVPPQLPTNLTNSTTPPNYSENTSQNYYTLFTLSTEPENTTTSSGSDENELAMVGVCGPESGVFSADFTHVYQKIYAGFYLLSFLIVLVLYGLIYRVIHIRNAKKAKRKRSSLFPMAPTEISVAAETQLTAMNGNHNNEEPENSPEQKTIKRKSIGIKERNFYANIRTAAMLFIVTIVFLFAFLPAWLMAHAVIPYSPIVFYMYFVYNVGNPIIYAFMNQSFRGDLKTLFCQVKRPH